MKLLWPMILILSALAAGLVSFVFPDIVGRPIVLTWFLFVCPGMTLIRFFQLKEPAIEWTLAIALSFVIDTAIASIQMYSGNWSPSITLAIIIAICLIGVFVRIIQIRRI